MPGITVVACGSSGSRSTDQTCSPDSHVLSAEEKLAAEESFSVYCKPIELYNILQRRAKKYPSFLQRCLDYRIKARHKRRIQMTVSLSQTVNETQTVFPLYICLARLVSDARIAKYSAVYRTGRIFIFQSSSGIDWNTLVQANFTLPEVNKLAMEAKSRSLFILVVSNVENPNSSSGVNASLVPLDLTSYASRAGEFCLCGKVSLESAYMAWDSSPNFSLGQRAEIMSTVDLLPCILKSDFPNEDKSISIQFPHNSENLSTSKQVQITISAEEFGAREKSPYNTYAGSEALSSSLSHIIRLREGNVIFNYRYYNNKLQRTEVTEDFSCPFCLVRCASFKGLRCHLSSSHDLFNFEYWLSEECQAVNVTLKSSEIVTDAVDPMTQTFCFCAKPFKHRGPKNLSFQNEKDVDPLVLESDFPAGDTELLEKDDGGKNHVRCDSCRMLALLLKCEECVTYCYDIAGVSNAIIQSHPDRDCIQPISENDLGSPAVLQSAKRGKLPVERSDAQSHPDLDFVQSISENDLGTPAVLQSAKRGKLPVEHSDPPSHPDSDCVQPISEKDAGTPAVLLSAKRGKLPVELSDPQNCPLLRKRQFYHSRTAQPMTLEEVLADQDSEDEIDDEVADIEDRRRLDTFPELTKDEKQMMHMWNSFTRKQRLVADGHIPWACAAFTKFHSAELVRSPGVAWCWRLFMIKLWNLGLLDPKTINQCNLTLEKYQRENPDPKS